MADLTIRSLRGGLNNTDAPSAIADDQCVTAENVEFNKSMLGEKRRGTTNVSLTGHAIASNSNLKVVTWGYRHLPSADETAAELWTLSTQSDGTQVVSLDRKTTAWSAVTAFDTIDVTSNRNYFTKAASLHGKMFHAYRSTNAADRLHCWDGTSHRRVGIIAPSAAPSVTNTGVGTFSGKRYYRVRFTVQSAGVTLRRSEPSAVTTFTPSGTGTSARITKPAASSPAEGETHWEVEASINNADFYRIATVVVGTTTYDDSISAYTVGYAANGTLSEDIGDYTLPWSAKFVVTDEDRLVIAGAWETSAYSSLMGWTPVQNDPGVGNDERIPIDSNNTLNLDGSDGGELTAFSNAINGYMFGFKLARIYKINRTNIRARAYEQICITKKRGALPNSLVEGLDATGQPALFFLDPRVGASMISVSGVQNCGYDILTTWRTVNLNGALVCHGIYDSESRQVHWWLAVNGSTTPNMKIVLQVNEIRMGDGGYRRGWATWSSGRSVSAYSSWMYSDNIDDNTTRSLKLVPFVGLVETGGDRNLIQRYITTSSTDSGSSYAGTVKTKPFIIAGLLNKMGVMAGALLAKAATGVVVSLKVIADFGRGNKTKQVDGISLTPTNSEDQVIVSPIDNLSLADMTAAQIEFGDLGTNSGLWEINQIAFAPDQEEQAAGQSR